MAYDLFGNGKTAVRANFGVHRALLDALDYRLDQTAPFNTTFSFSNTTVDKLASLASGTATGSGQISPSNVQPDIATPTVLAWTFKIEQQVAPATSLTIGYVGSHGYHQILSEDQNTPATVTCPRRHALRRLRPGPSTIRQPTKANPNVANTTSWVSQGISNYNGLEVDVRRQFRTGCSCAAFIPLPAIWTTVRPGIPASRQTLRPLSCIREILGWTMGRRPPISAMLPRSMAHGSCLSATGCWRTQWRSSWSVDGR